ncbi:MAG: ribosome-associated translation inhibitor RaiA [Candidatus Dadabacteria bacterium]|nr:MAG: ribosome-associated translation inhibitor RaiA [Candidatus Dadabacteria bacterium]
MQVSVTFRHIEPSEALRSYATDKLKRVVGKYLRRPIEAHVILSVVKHNHTAEISVHASHFDATAKESTGDLYSAIDLALDKIENQLRKHKDRINRRKGRTPAAGEPLAVRFEVLEAEEAEAGQRRVIERNDIPAKPLSVEDAILELEQSRAEFLVFRESDSEAISVLYKRRDGNYGLITPSA